MRANGFTIPQIVALIFLAIVIVLIVIFVGKVIPSKEVVYVEYEESDKPEIILNGSYVEYIEMNDIYEDKGVTAVNRDGKNISNYIIKTIYEDNSVVTTLDTSNFNTYKIRYEVTDPDDKSLVGTASRVVIVIDSTAPKISLPETQTITSSEVLTYDLEKDVVATDNSGTVTLTYDNTLMPIDGEYVITYKAVDSSGNQTTRKRLIKVTDSIEINEEGSKIVIDYPSSPSDQIYTYKYSLDGGNTWIDTTKHTELSLNDVIAAVYENDNYIMSISYKSSN